MEQPYKLAVLAAVDESKIASVKLVTDLLTSLRAAQQLEMVADVIAIRLFPFVNIFMKILRYQ